MEDEKTMEDLENELRDWALQRPSAQFKARISMVLTSLKTRIQSNH